jgi:hypothetical protein
MGMDYSIARSLHSKVLTFVSASTLANCVVVSWIAIESRYSDLSARFDEQLPHELMQHEALLHARRSAACWTLEDAVSRESNAAHQVWPLRSMPRTSWLVRP